MRVEDRWRDLLGDVSTWLAAKTYFGTAEEYSDRMLKKVVQQGRRRTLSGRTVRRIRSTTSVRAAE
ncbi:MAG: hypothetical protein ACRD3J_20750, partial [Thermoanaerobaculia bacterium]